jgi:hypothetical protein
LVTSAPQPDFRLRPRENPARDYTIFLANRGNNDEVNSCYFVLRPTLTLLKAEGFLPSRPALRLPRWQGLNRGRAGSRLRAQSPQEKGGS